VKQFEPFGDEGAIYSSISPNDVHLAEVSFNGGVFL
jgi:hypothetical protein